MQVHRLLTDLDRCDVMDGNLSFNYDFTLSDGIDFTFVTNTYATETHLDTSLENLQNESGILTNPIKYTSL